MRNPLDNYKLPDTPQNLFGGIRKYDIHTGVDLFCQFGDNIYSIEYGEVINVFKFTGESVGSPWWNETSGILIRGKHNILYGEIYTHLKVGDIVNEGDVIGSALTVLKKDKGLPMTMLHIEQYELDYLGDGVIWKIGDEKPDKLIDITNLLYSI